MMNGPSPASAERSPESQLAVRTKALLDAGDSQAACEVFGEIVLRQQRRALRIALHYLRDAADADEAVQDAFVRAYSHMQEYREEYPFEVWLTRILVNGCLDRLKAHSRRNRWFVPLPELRGEDGSHALEATDSGPSPEDALLAAERGEALREALTELSDRQRTVFVLSQQAGYTAREVSQVTGLNESTVRVHLFRAIRRLRTLLRETLPAAREVKEA